MKFLNKIVKSFKQFKLYEMLMIVILLALEIRAYIITICTYDYVPVPTPGWLAMLELISGICEVFSLFLAAKANRQHFVFYCIVFITSVVSCWYWKNYDSLAWNLFFHALLNIVAWINWTKHKDEENQLLVKTKKMTALQIVMTLAAILAITFAYRSVLEGLGNFGSLASFVISVITIIADFLGMLRYREQYWLLIAINLYWIAMYDSYLGLLYLIVNAIYLAVAIIGSVNWGRLSKKNKTNE